MISRRGVQALCVGGAAALLSSKFPRYSFAQNAGSGDVVGAVARASTVPRPSDVAASLEAQMNTFARESGLQERADNGELALARGTADVRVPASHPDWVRLRSLAYERAYAAAQTSYVTSLGLRIVSDVESSAFRAAGDEPPPFNPGREQAPGRLNDLARKLAGLANARVDELLREANIDPRQYEVAPPPQRHVMLREAFRRQTVRRAIGELSGMVPCKTFEGHDGRGNFQISVLAVASPAMRDFAAEVQRRRGDFAPNPARAGDLTAMTENKDDLVRQFGVRRVFDADGFPALVSFGQWGAAQLGVGGSNARAAALDRVAIAQARSMADASIGMFLSASATFETTSDVGDVLESAASRLPDNMIMSHADTTSLADALQERFRARSDVRVVGLSDLGGVWRHQHPLAGAEIIGVVRIWSARGERMSRTLQENRPASAPSTTVS